QERRCGTGRTTTLIGRTCSMLGGRVACRMKAIDVPATSGSPGGESCRAPRFCCPSQGHAPTKRARSSNRRLESRDVLGPSAMAFPRQVPGIPLRSPFHELRTDVVYGEAGGTPLRFDHYRPLTGAEPAPVVIFVHGGGWMRGDPSQAAGNALHFARRGIATVALSYRLAPEHRFPAPLDDVRHGLRWVRAHAGELGVDPDRIALLGLSAGAPLSVLPPLPA